MSIKKKCKKTAECRRAVCKERKHASESEMKLVPLVTKAFKLSSMEMRSVITKNLDISHN